MKTTRVDPSRAPLYLQKARRYADAAQASFEKGLFDPAASAAIHAVINAADAACVHYTGQRSTGTGHHEAIEILERIDGPPYQERNRLVRHLGILLGLKTLAEYDDRSFKESQARQALTAMRRALAIVERWSDNW